MDQVGDIAACHFYICVGSGISSAFYHNSSLLHSEFLLNTNGGGIKSADYFNFTPITKIGLRERN